MRNRLLFTLAVIGIAAGILSAALFAVRPQPLAPVFNPAPNPYDHGIFANGIIESDQASGENVNVYPEVPGTVTEILVREGATVSRGTPLVHIEDSVQRGVTEQQQAQADAAHALLEELRAQPRPENLEVAVAQVAMAHASLKTSEDQLAKQEQSYAADPRSVSRNALDDARNAVRVARANLAVAERQLALVKAGAWSFDIRNQEAQYNALSKAAAAGQALLAKYVIRAPADGTILSINAAVGSYVSSQGTFDTYTQTAVPVVVMGAPQDYVAVRCYIDEILIAKLHTLEQLEAQMYIRGTDVRIPLEFVRVQPYVSPKIALSNERTERVDLRVLPIIFRFKKAADAHVYPGQLVDVYVKAE